jgi:hypothetical protein
MHSNTDINAIVNKAKQQRADYIGSKLQGGAFPLAIALAALVAISFVSFDDAPSESPAAQTPVVQVTAQNG